MNKEAYRLTYSGGKFYLFDPERWEFDIVDISHHLSLICRYGGATYIHYSVAQHSVLVARIMEHKRFDKKGVLAALLHDAAEAYFGDSISPWKEAFPEIYQIQEKCQEAIWKWAGCEIDKEYLQALNEIDQLIRLNEIRAFFPYGQGNLVEGIPLPLNFEIIPWDAGTAKFNFYTYYQRLRE